MNSIDTARIDPSVMYKSVRDEILEQKKCQFNLFAASVTVNAAVLAYSTASKVGPLVYIAPIVLNILAVTIILDKAGSIQRMVGYLQLMENPVNEFQWMWEFHLRRYRAAPGRSEGFEGFRRHSYVITVASMLLVLNLLCAALYFRGPSAISLRLEPNWSKLAEFYGAVNAMVIGFVAWGFIITIYRWAQLIVGKSTSMAVERRWRYAITGRDDMDKK